MPLLHFVTSAL